MPIEKLASCFREPLYIAPGIHRTVRHIATENQHYKSCTHWAVTTWSSHAHA